MGWGNCGVDSDGRPIGYVFEGTCDESGCDKDITRGIDQCCGGMHGECEVSCEKYFCDNHLVSRVTPPWNERGMRICKGCGEELLATEEWVEDALEAEIIPVEEFNRRYPDGEC